jgi:hypothetical protein
MGAPALVRDPLSLMVEQRLRWPGSGLRRRPHHAREPETRFAAEEGIKER